MSSARGLRVKNPPSWGTGNVVTLRRCGCLISPNVVRVLSSWQCCSPRNASDWCDYRRLKHSVTQVMTDGHLQKFSSPPRYFLKNTLLIRLLSTSVPRRQFSLRDIRLRLKCNTSRIPYGIFITISQPNEKETEIWKVNVWFPFPTPTHTASILASKGCHTRARECGIPRTHLTSLRSFQVCQLGSAKCSSLRTSSSSRRALSYAPLANKHRLPQRPTAGCPEAAPSKLLTRHRLPYCTSAPFPYNTPTFRESWLNTPRSAFSVHPL